MMLWVLLLAVLAITPAAPAAGADQLEILDRDGLLGGRAIVRPGGSIDLFDAHSGRVGWGRQDRNGNVELFDVRGNRIGTWERDRGRIRLERK